MSPVSIPTLHRRYVPCLAGILSLAVLVTPLLGQNAVSISSCDHVITTRDAARCIGSERPNAPIPVLDPTHTYTLSELIDITEMASPEGRIAWATAKQALDLSDRAHALAPTHPAVPGLYAAAYGYYSASFGIITAIAHGAAGEFKKRAGYAPEGVAAITYSAVMLMADGIKRANSDDPAKVRDALAATKDFPTLEGSMNGFNSLHELLMPISVNVIKDGQFKPAGEITDLSAFAPPEK